MNSEPNREHSAKSKWIALGVVFFGTLGVNAAIATLQSLQSARLGYIFSQLLFVATVGGLLGRTWVRGFVGTALCAFVWVLVPTTIVYHEEFTVGASQLSFIAATLLIASVPSVVLRHAFRWRLVHTSESARPSSPLTLSEVFAVVALASLLLIVARIPLATGMHGVETSVAYWTRLAMMGSVLAVLASATTVPVLYGVFVLRPERSWIRLAIIALAIPVGLLTGLTAMNEILLNGSAQAPAKVLLSSAVTGVTAVAYPLLASAVLFGGGYRLDRERRAASSDVVAAAFGNRAIIGGSIVLAVAITLLLMPVEADIARHAKMVAWIAERGGKFIESDGRSDGFDSVQLGSTKVEDDELHLLSGAARVGSLELQQTNIGDAGLAHVAELPFLTQERALTPGHQSTSLFLDHTRVTDDGLKHLSQLCGLDALSLNETAITDKGLTHLRRLPTLFSLQLRGTRVTGATFGQLSGCTIANLNLRDTSLNDAGCDQLAKLASLTALNVRGTQITDAGLKQLGAFPYLSRLDAARTQVTGAGLRSFRDSKLLNSVNLLGTSCADDALEHLATCPRLAVLNLSETQVTDAGIKALEPLTKLWDLNLAQTSVTDVGLAALGKHEQLVSLNLAGTGIDGRGFADWPSRPAGGPIGMTGGMAGGSGLTLDLSDTLVDDSTVPLLARLTDLYELDLAGTSVTDKSLPILLQMNVVRLSIQGTKITATGLLNSQLKGLQLFVDEDQFTAAEQKSLQRACELVTTPQDEPAQE